MKPHTIDIDGPVFYAEWDGPGAGPTFVLAHGLGASHINWFSIAPLLAQRGRVLALDFAGFGRTPLQGRTSSVEANRELLDRFIERVAGEAVVLVGNSMGGLISILQAAARPDATAGLVLLDPASPRATGQTVDRVVAAMFATYMIPAAGERFVAARARRLGPEGLVRETLRMCTVDPERVDSEVIDEMLAFARERSETMPWATTAFLQATRSMIRILARRNKFMVKVRAISSPTLLLQGRHDRLVAFAAAEAIARARPDWDFVVFDDLGHVPHLEDPAATYAAIETWLDGPAARLLGNARAEDAG